MSVVLVDGHALVRSGVRSLLDPDSRFEVVGEAATGAEAMLAVADRHPDIVLTDAKLRDTSGAELCKRTLAESPDTAVVVLTDCVDRHAVDACLLAGARGYLLKDAEHVRLREHLLTAADGHSVLDPRAAEVLTAYVRRSDPPSAPLTPRELETLRLIANGYTTNQIGAELNVSTYTVKGHVRRILAKLECHSRIEAVVAAKERGLL